MKKPATSDSSFDPFFSMVNIFFQLVLLALVGMVAASPLLVKREADADAAYLYGGYGYLGGYPYGAAYAPYGLGYAAGLVKE